MWDIKTCAIALIVKSIKYYLNHVGYKVIKVVKKEKRVIPSVEILLHSKHKDERDLALLVLEDLTE